MSKHTFHLKDPDSLILVDCIVQKDRYTLALDTGASHTVLDLTPLLIIGYELKNALRTVEFETGKGIVEAYVFCVPQVSALGVTRKNFEICAYDFLANNILSDMDGVLGLDFFRNKDLFISFKRSEIEVS